MIVQNQIGGGGLSNAELAEATATAAQVLSGYTFFAGNDEMKVGELVPTPKVKFGTTSSVEPDQTKTINVGFEPLVVCIWSEDEGDWCNCWCYNGTTYLTGSGNVNNIVDVSKTRITITDSGFTLDNEVYTTYYGDFYPFDVGYHADIIYLAIG